MITSTSAMRRASLTAGVALALMAVLGGFAALGVIEPMITAGDATGTAQRIAASPALFRFGIACLVTVVVLDVIVSPTPRSTWSPSASSSRRSDSSTSPPRRSVPSAPTPPSGTWP